MGQSDGAGAGVVGVSKSGIGVRGTSEGGRGVDGESMNGEGMRGTSHNANHGGVVGVNTGGGIAVYGTSDNHVGVWGTSVNHEGIHAETKSNTTAAIAAYNRSENGTGAAIFAKCDNSEGIHAETKSAVTAAMAAYQMNSESDSPALYAKHADRNRNAAFFEGNLVVTGDITLANAADCAEDFDISAESCAEPGTVMVLDDESKLRESFHPYDKRVAGVISGAGNYKPGLVLDKQQSQSNRKPIALLGKVFCKVDARFGPIEVGDLLTTSPTAGHAMRVDDPLKAFGAVIGKALRPLTDGQGLIPILIALQ